MSAAIEQMLKSYRVDNIYDRKNAMKEIMQEIVLCGLSRAGFFKKAAFYGGTALRIFYGLDRFSEDLDFSPERFTPLSAARGRAGRIKGRDLYDYVFYLSRGAAVNQRHLRERLIDSGYIFSDADCSITAIKRTLSERFDSIDYVQARQDVEPFIHDSSVMDVWNPEFFKQITENLTAV